MNSTLAAAADSVADVRKNAYLLLRQLAQAGALPARCLREAQRELCRALQAALAGGGSPGSGGDASLAAPAGDATAEELAEWQNMLREAVSTQAVLLGCGGLDTEAELQASMSAVLVDAKKKFA
jgi:hypothetical protein